MRPQRLLILLALASAPLLSACVLDSATVRDAAQSAGFTPKPPQSADFVVQSRRENTDYLPVGVSAPPRTIRAKSATGVKDLEADLDASRRRNEAKGKDAAKAVVPAAR
ncbi:hypothetical protein [Methylobacterium sp. ID0610]|uniref:hypothetical protein n=1 Tax=Methylobacterium carpenticola TaxID=3344827 RepID=UPI0036B9FB57